jgi:hypothetical protein
LSQGRKAILTFLLAGRHRVTSVKVREHHDLLASARAHAFTAAFTEPYRQHRPMVERSIAWLIRRGGRKDRYRGITRNRIGLAHRG